MATRALSMGCLMVLALAPALSARTSSAVSCAVNEDVLGLERIVEIDATGGPEFGSTRSGGYDFLADGEVVLTFDDGPSRAHTRPVLAALDRHCTKATFFMVGRMAAADPSMVQEVAARGHTVAGHTFSHARISDLSAAKAEEEIELGFSAVSRALDAPVAPFFRYPYLRTSTAADAHLRKRDIATFMIDIDSQDFRTRDADVLKRTVLSELGKRRKGILLFHDIQPGTANALDDLLGELKAHGYKVVHIVPKSTAETLAAYDTRADRLIERRKLAVAKKPLAGRSVTWAQENATEGDPQPWTTRITPAASEPLAASVTSNPESAVPWYRQWLFP